MGKKDFLCLKTWMAIAAVVLLILSTAAPLCSAQEVRDKKLPLVWVLATGGTIAGRGTSPTDLSNYKSGALTGEEIVRSVPQLEQLAHDPHYRGRRGDIERRPSLHGPGDRSRDA